MKQLVVFLGVLGASASAILVRFSTAPSMVLAFYRVLLSTVLLVPLVAWRHREELGQVRGRDLALCLLSGGCLGLHFASYFEALQWTSIASALLFTNGEVLVVAFGSLLFLKERFSKRAWLGVLLAFGGSAAVALSDAGGGSNALLGDALALLAAVLVGIYTMLGTVCRRRISTTVYTFFVYAAATATLLVALLARRVPLGGYEPVNWLTSLGLAVFCTLLGHSVFSWGLKYLPAALISMMKLLEPAIASVWGAILFREIPNPAVMAGGAVVIAGLCVYLRSTEKSGAEG